MPTDEENARQIPAVNLPPLARRVIARMAGHLAEFRGTVVDIGGATSRFLWEWQRRYPATERLVLVEPSVPFATWARRFLTGEDRDQPMPFVDRPSRPRWGRPESWPEPLPAGRLEIINAAAEEASLPPASFDVVSCCNVADRHPDPRALVQTVTTLARPGGMLILSSPLDWKSEFTSEAAWVDDLAALLPAGWAVLESWDEPYPFRYHDRFDAVFLTQVLCCVAPASPSGGTT
ncbi:MAG: class I SAM-dependent methyltransferase [bacterium]|nr:class I SAM-dependent methyltransferase [bacterium]